VQNTQNFPTGTNSWFDSVYLSASTTLDASARLIERVPENRVLGPMESYTGVAQATLPGAIPGDYHVIVICDSRGQVPDVNRANNTLASTRVMHVDMTALTPEVPFMGTIGNGQDEYFRVALPAGNSDRITASFGAPAGAELYVRYQDAPDPARYDQFAFDATREPQQILLSGPQAGTYYLLVHGRQGAGSGQPFTLLVHELTFAIVDVTPRTGGNSGPVTVTIQGVAFSPHPTVSLVAAGGSTYSASSVLFQSSSSLFATFNRVPVGTYHLRIDAHGNSDTDPLPFTVVPGQAGQVVYNMSAPSYVRGGMQGTVTVTYENIGNTDAPAPLLALVATNALVRLPDQPGFYGDTTQFLAISPTGPAGIIPPGVPNQIIIDFQAATGISQGQISFALGLAALDQPINWSQVHDDLQPPDVPSDAWNALWGNFLNSVGTTAGQLQTVLDQDATYLSLLGEYTPDPDRLISFELQKADDFGALTQRYTLGAFGRGWPDPANIQAATDSFGNVTIEYSGRVRSFFRQQGGSYQGVPGDAATLTVSSGIYQLRETDGTLTVFNANGTLNYTQDTNGNRITAHDTGSQLTCFTDSLGNTVRFHYNVQGRIDQVTDPVGRISTYRYDPSGQHLMSVTDETGTTSYTYVTGQGGAREHALQSIAFPDGTHRYFTYNDQGRLQTQSRDGGAEALTYGYDNEGTITVTDAGGGISAYLLNEFEEIAQYIDPLGRLSRFTYDANHNLTAEVGPDGITSTFTTDAQGNPTSTVDPLGNRVAAAYDPVLNRLQALTDAKGNTTRYQTDPNGNVQAIVYPDGSQEQFRYDPNGFLTDSTNRRGQTIHYVVQNGLVIHEDFADNTHADFLYDAHRNLTSATDSSGTVSLEYHDPTNPDLLTKVTYPSGRYLQFTYLNGRRVRMVDQDGFTVCYHYDDVGRLDSLRDGSGALIVSYHYDGAGRLDRKLMGNGTYTTYQYDAASEVHLIVNYAPDGSVISRFCYVYDNFGRPTSVNTLTGTTTYTCDADGQLTSVTLPGGRTITYQYDANGNRVAVTDGGVMTTYISNNLNQYTTVGGTAYTYDADGNLVAKTDATGTTTYTYNGLGQLVTVTSPAGTWTYQYDALGQRMSATENGRQTQYLIDPTGLGDVVGEYTSNGSRIAHYTQGLGLTSRVDATGASAYYDFDLTGNTTELTGPSGTVLNSYTYLPFGEIVSATETTLNPFLYVGQFGVMSDGSGQYFMRNRWYDAHTGRFTRPDPIGQTGGTNLYAYTFNDPIILRDPEGTQVSPIPPPIRPPLPKKPKPIEPIKPIHPGRPPRNPTEQPPKQPDKNSPPPAWWIPTVILIEELLEDLAPALLFAVSGPASSDGITSLGQGPVPDGSPYNPCAVAGNREAMPGAKLVPLPLLFEDL
jgi:RHS repeat-associated protein